MPESKPRGAPDSEAPPQRVLIYGAGVLGSLYAARLHEAGHDVELVARGERLASLREHGLLLAEGESAIIRSVPVRVVEAPEGRYDLTLLFVRTHQVDAVLTSIAGFERGGTASIAALERGGDASSAGFERGGGASSAGDILLLLNWAGGAAPLTAALGPGRVLFGFASQGGTMDDSVSAVVRYRPASLLTRFIAMPIGEPDGSSTARVERIVQLFRDSGFAARPEPQMDAWLRTHAAFEVPLGMAVHAEGGLEALAGHPDALRAMLAGMRRNLAALPTRPVPRTFGALRTLPVWMLVPLFRRFLRSGAAAPLATDSPAVRAELDALAGQLRADPPLETVGRTS